MHLERRTDYDRHTAFIVPIFLVCFVLVIGVFTGGVLILNKNSPKRSTTEGTGETPSATQEKKNKQPQRVPLARLLSVLSGRKAMRESMIVETTIAEPPAITVTSASLPADLHRVEPIEDEKAHVRAFSTLAPRHEFLRLPIAGRQRVEDHDEHDRQSSGAYDSTSSNDHEGSDEDSALSAIWDSFCASGEGRLHELRTLSYLSFGEQAASKYDEATKGRLGGGDVHGLPANDAYGPPVGVNDAPKSSPASPLPPPGLSASNVQVWTPTGLDPDVKTHTSLMSSNTLVVYPALSRSATLPKGCSPPLVSPPSHLYNSSTSHASQPEISYWSPEKKPRSRWALELFGRANGKKEFGRGNGKQEIGRGKQEKENAFKTEPILPLSFDIPDENYVPPGSDANPFFSASATRSSSLDDPPATAVFCPAPAAVPSSAMITSSAARDTPTITLTVTDSMDEVAECLANVTVDSSDIHGVGMTNDAPSAERGDNDGADSPPVRRVSLQPRRRSLARAPAVRKDIFAV